MKPKDNLNATRRSRTKGAKEKNHHVIITILVGSQ